MELKTVTFIVRGTQGEACKVIFDAEGNAISGDMEAVLGAMGDWRPAKPKKTSSKPKSEKADKSDKKDKSEKPTPPKAA